jgi:hypothetical protein
MNITQESVVIEPAKDMNIVIQSDEQKVPNNYLTWSVFNTICCCSLFGILATIYSVKTKESIRHGLSKQEILIYSDRAFFLNSISLICGFTTLNLYFYAFIYSK